MKRVPLLKIKEEYLVEDKCIFVNEIFVVIIDKTPTFVSH